MQASKYKFFLSRNFWKNPHKLSSSAISGCSTKRSISKIMGRVSGLFG